MTIEHNNYFIDTNILIYHSYNDNIFYPKARQIIEQIKSNEIGGYISAQIINEYFSVVTNPKRVPNQLQKNEANNNIQNYLDFLVEVSIYPKCKDISDCINKYDIIKRQIFDLNIYLTMKQNNLSKIITANEKDFKIFKDIEVINPFK